MAKEAATLSLNDGRSCTRKQWRWRELRMEDCLDAYGNLALPRPPLLRLHRLCSRESSCPTSPLVPRRMIRGRREGGARQGQEDVSMFGASTTTSPCRTSKRSLDNRICAYANVKYPFCHSAIVSMLTQMQSDPHLSLSLSSLTTVTRGIVVLHHQLER
ncbi:hypothetical protein BHE74_00012754 [Ensete ventricosum]|nr:hypothetical protein GW17_00033707 [Ensete ventricosum]RWW78981.1 hypothetical protein BHE74_00012754 [Ensete ventricosum]